MCWPGFRCGACYYTHLHVHTSQAFTTLDILADPGLAENAQRQGEYALHRLQEMKARHPLVGDVRGRGLLLGVELVSVRDAKTPANAAAETVLYRALARGLSFKITLGNILTLSPPLIIGETELSAALDLLEICIAETEYELLQP